MKFHLEELENRLCPSVPTPHDGVILHNPDVVPVFFGSINPTFEQAVLVAVGDYNNSVLPVFGVGAAHAEAPIVLPYPGTLTNGSLTALLNADTQNGTLPSPSANTLYMIFVPQAAMGDVPNAGSYHGGAGFGGSPFPFTVCFTVGPNAGPYGVFHEYAEAVTDPYPGFPGHEGWYGDNFTQEIADLGGGASVNMDGFPVAVVMGPQGQLIPSTPSPPTPLPLPPPSPSPVTVLGIPDFFAQIEQEILAIWSAWISYEEQLFSLEVQLWQQLYGGF